MRIASRKGKRVATPKSARRRPTAKRRDPFEPEGDKRLFAQLTASAVLVAVAVVVSMTEGGMRDGLTEMLHGSADLSAVNSMVEEFSQDIPVLSTIFGEDTEGTEVFSETPVTEGAATVNTDDGGAEVTKPSELPLITHSEFEGDSQNEQPSDGIEEEALKEDTLQEGYTTYVVAPPIEEEASTSPEFVSGFDEQVFDALPDIDDSTDIETDITTSSDVDQGGGDLVAAASGMSSSGGLGLIFASSLVAEDPPPETTTDGREVPDDSTLEKIDIGTDLVSPAYGWISSSFGSRGDGMEQEFHHGLDIAANKGEPIYAVAGGRIIEVGSNSIYGNYVVVEHEGELTSKYAHCTDVVVRENERVKQGEKIATVGSTGLSTGSHLHLELKFEGIFVDPEHYFEVTAQ